MAATFTCTLITPQEEILSEEVLYASVPASDGLFGVQAGRAPVMLELGDGPLRLDYPQGGSRHFFVGGGFAQVEGGVLTILSDEAHSAERVLVKQAEQDLEAAKALSARTDEDFERRQRAITRAKQMKALGERFREQGL